MEVLGRSSLTAYFQLDTLRTLNPARRRALWVQRDELDTMLEICPTQDTRDEEIGPIGFRSVPLGSVADNQSAALVALPGARPADGSPDPVDLRREPPDPTF